MSPTRVLTKTKIAPYLRPQLHSKEVKLMYLRVIQTTSPSKMMREMLVAYYQTNYIPWVLSQGCLSGRFVNVDENKGMLILTFPDKETALKVMELRKEDRAEIKKSHKLSRMEGKTAFFMEG